MPLTPEQEEKAKRFRERSAEIGKTLALGQLQQEAEKSDVEERRRVTESALDDIVKEIVSALGAEGRLPTVHEVRRRVESHPRVVIGSGASFPLGMISASLRRLGFTVEHNSIL